MLQRKLKKLQKIYEIEYNKISNTDITPNGIEETTKSFEKFQSSIDENCFSLGHLR